MSAKNKLKPFMLIPAKPDWIAPVLSNLKANERLNQMAHEFNDLRDDLNGVIQYLSQSGDGQHLCRCAYSGALCSSKQIVGFTGVSESSIEDAYWDECWPPEGETIERFHLGIVHHFTHQVYNHHHLDRSKDGLKKTPLGRVVLELGYKPGLKWADMPNFGKMVPQHIKNL